MKRILAVAFAVAILSLGFSASAQTPFVQVFFDDYGTVANDTCPPCGLETQQDVISVYAVNFNMWIVAIEYMIDYSPALAFMGDIMEPCNLNIGNSPTGIAISMPCLGNGFAPLRTQRASVWWNCCENCSGFENSAVIVLPHPDSGKVRAVQWQTNLLVDGVGMTSMICQTGVATQETTWGGIKSLYNQ